MGRHLLKACALTAVLSLAAVACSKSTPPRASSSGSPAASSASPAAVVPTANTITLPVTYGYYDGHIDTMLSTDVSNKAQASSTHINYSAAMVTQPAKDYPSLYQISGPAAANQPQVFGSQPGEDDYSPLWQQVTVRWKSGVTPVLLVKDDQVKALAAQGKLIVTPTPIVLNCPIVKVG